MAKGNDADMSMDGFELGAPSLICRWRLSNRHLPLANRHLRALLARTVNGKEAPKELVAWAKQHIEWTLEQGSAAHPHGVLMLLVDETGRAAMTVGPYEELEDTRLASLAQRAARATREARKTHVAPETLWVSRMDKLVWDPGEDCAPSGSASLVLQLAQTLGIDVQVYDDLLGGLDSGTLTFEEAFLVSDEHGIVPASDRMGRHGKRMAEGYQRLLERA